MKGSRKEGEREGKRGEGGRERELFTPTGNGSEVEDRK
jgi:hypothetical protein